MNFIREEETKNILKNCRLVTPQWILDYLLEHENDSDCVYIFENLPKDINKAVDDLAIELVRTTRIKSIEAEKQIKEIQEKRKEVAEKRKEVTEKRQNVGLLEDYLTEYSKQNKMEIYQLQQQLENVRELNRQLGI